MSNGSRLLARRHGADPDRSVTVGDREHDIAGVRHSGHLAFAAEHGHGSEAELWWAVAGEVARSVDDDPALLFD